MTHDTKRLTRIMKALANENRLELYLQIRRQEAVAVAVPTGCECFVSDIAAKMKIGAPTISHHIKELESAELITVQKVGKQITAAINEETLRYLQTIFKV
ncbi:winged helix-turn-helix transcriptional regulator [Pontibacter qinzhouensis]|uniref:Winged helix-turn-helix transcriptional regulator n=1 Tax=Pontibacter qinzhouensis TaxID=2603253 RepID=A0A5C8KER3_9BACT|nr:metalloregulator ArsR/SmtB family transcription factor [Pontibacter qinzhouensis]TXK52154.1 winged helix-turn-helix transcriptional regulator [Pontibacter qinzhouensis]